MCILILYVASSGVDHDQLLPHESQHAPFSMKTVQQSTQSTQKQVTYSQPFQVGETMMKLKLRIPIRNEVLDCKQEWEMMHVETLA